MKKGLGKIRKIKKKHIFLALLAVIVLGGLAKAYSAWVGTTRIAFLNYQAIALGQISHANDNAMIKLSEITTDDFDHLDDYDMIIVNGMGLRIDENQRKQLEEASYKVPTLTHAATNPANNIVSVDNFDADYLMQYIENGSKKNYHSMLAYIRKFIDGKKFMAPEPERVDERPDYLLTHFDPKDEKGDELGFNSIREYNAFLAKNGLYKKGAPTILLTGFMGAAPDMEKAFEKKGFMVYRINQLQSFIAGHHADSIQANAVVNMAHGRLGDYFVEFLKQKNILGRNFTQNLGRMRRHDKLHFREGLLKPLHNFSLPRRMQMHVQFINKNNPSIRGFRTAHQQGGLAGGLRHPRQNGEFRRERAGLCESEEQEEQQQAYRHLLLQGSGSECTYRFGNGSGSIALQSPGSLEE